MSTSDGYNLVRCLGTGIAGPVYLADTSTGQRAIRQFASLAPVNSDLWNAGRERFLRSARQWMALKHTNILPVLEVIDEAGEAFVVMEYDSSPTLQAELSSRRFTFQEANALLRQLARALDFAHDQGVVHGDLKPSDIFLAPNGTARISEFAISPRLRPGGDPSLMNPGHDYLSPEHLRDPGQINFQSDQFSLGLIAYQIYVGGVPNGGGPSLRNAVLAGALPAPSTINSQLPRNVDAPILRALNRTPGRRFSSCLEFVSVLEANVISQPEPTRRRSAVSAGYALLAALAVLALYFVWSDSNGRSNAISQAPGVVPASQSPAQAPKQPPQAPSASQAAAQVKTASSTTGFVSQVPKRKTGAPENAKPAPVRDEPASDVRPVNVARRVDRAAPDFDHAAAAGRFAPPARVNPGDFGIDVFSRTNPISEGLSFGAGDVKLGELAQGDLKAMVQFDGLRLPRGKLTLEWSVDNITMDKRPVAPNQLVEYGNEPTAGSYRVTLRMDGRPVHTFSFRITP